MSLTAPARLVTGLLAALVVALIACAGGPSAETELPPDTPVPTSVPESGNRSATVPPDPPPENGIDPGAPPAATSPAPGDARATQTPPSPTATANASAVPPLGSATGYVEGVGERQEIAPTIKHVDLNDDPNDDFVAYDSFPPTSGDHWSTPVRCGFYIQAIPDEMVVHNMEHSNIVVSYNLTSQDDFDTLVDVYDSLPEIWRDHFTVVRPYGRIAEGQVALSTWGVLDRMEGVDAERILRFFEHYVGKLGPEGPISCRGTQEGMSGG